MARTAKGRLTHRRAMTLDTQRRLATTDHHAELTSAVPVNSSARSLEQSYGIEADPRFDHFRIAFKLGTRT